MSLCRLSRRGTIKSFAACWRATHNKALTIKKLGVAYNAINKLDSQVDEETVKAYIREESEAARTSTYMASVIGGSAIAPRVVCEREVTTVHAPGKLESIATVTP